MFGLRLSLRQSLFAVPVIVEEPSGVSVIELRASLPVDGNLRLNLSVVFLPRTVFTNGSNSIMLPFHFPL